MNKVLLGILVILVVGLGGAWFYLDRIAQSAVEREGTRALGVPVLVDSMALSPFSGRLGMDGFRVANPEGFSDASVLRLDSGRLGIRLGSLFDDVVVLPEIALDGLHVRLERNEQGTNLKRLLDNLDSGSGGEAPPAEGGEPTRVRVSRLSITNAGASVDLGPEFGDRGKFDVTLPSIELRDIGTDGNGVTVEQLVEHVSRAVIDAIRESAASRLPDLIRRELGQRLEQQREKLESEAREAVEQETDRLKEQLDDAGSGLFD